MAANNSITFILVPGAWHPASCLDLLARRLKSSGYQAKSIDSPSVGAEPPLESFDPDVQAIHKAIEEEADNGQDVVVFMHSYGGMIGSQACQGLDKKTREAGNKTGGVVRLIYCCAFMVPEGISLFEACGSSRPPWQVESDDGRRIDVVTPIEIFYNDMTEEHAAEVKKTLKHHSQKAFMSKLSYPAYRDIPTTYILCTKDNAIPIAAQEGWVEGAKKLGSHIETFRLEASHSPFYSMPDKVAAICFKSVAGNL